MAKKASRKDSAPARNHNPSQATETKPDKPIQFDWRTHWKTKVKPHLHHPFVQFALNIGMGMTEPTWMPGDRPFRAGHGGRRRVRKGTLAWYQRRLAL